MIASICLLSQAVPGRLAENVIVNAMADREDKNQENIDGKFYVDTQCIDCDLCRETAPENFKREEDEGYSYVYKQPDNQEEEDQCREAMEGCPVEAIGEDGAG